jgi:hypothetical protein
MTIFNVPWIPRYIGGGAPRAVIAAHASRAGRAWVWVHAKLPPRVVPRGWRR